MGIIIINGKRYKGNNIHQVGNKIWIDGKLQDEENVKKITITIDGDIERLEFENGKVEVNGSVGNIATQSGDVRCAEVGGSISTMSGDVICKEIGGSVSTMSGDIVNK